MMVLDNFGVFGVGCHSERSYLISSPNRIVSDSFRAYLFVHDVTRSESFRNSKSSGNFLRQSKHDFNQGSTAQTRENLRNLGPGPTKFCRSVDPCSKCYSKCYPKTKLVFTLRTIKMFTKYFMDDRKCFEDVLRMREFHELLSGLIHEFIKWFNMG